MQAQTSTPVADNAYRLFAGALALYVVVLPISGTTALRSLAFAMLVGVTLWSAATRRLRLRLPLWPAWGAYAVVACISLLYAADAHYSAGEIKVEILYEAAIFAIAASWIRNEAGLAKLALLFVVANGIFVLGSLANVLTQPFHPALGMGAWGTGVGSTSTAIVTEMPWLAAYAVHALRNGKRRTAFAVGLLMVANLGALFLSMNRQGWLALAVALAVALLLAEKGFWTRRRKLLAAAVAAAFVALLAAQFLMRAQSMAGTAASSEVGASTQAVQKDIRWKLWRFSLERISERPWSGGGFGREAFDRLYHDFHIQSGSPLWHAHNMVINKGIQMGVPGMVAFLALWLALAAAVAKGLRVPDLRPWAVATLAMIAGIFMRNMADDFFVRDHALMFWLLAGAYLGAQRRATGSP